MSSEAYNALNRVWKGTTKVLLGQEIGELSEYEPWLAEHIVPILHKKSALSKKDVYCAVSDYPDDARFVSLEEVQFDRKFEPLDINQIKDIDSIIESLGERFQYCGNIVLGNSKYVERSSDVQNSFYVLGSNFVYDCEYVAYSSYTRASKRLFAVISDYGCSDLIRVFETHKQSRCFEAWKCYDSSDVYFSSCVQGSQDAMFSFNLKNKKNVIGNVELSREKYLELKKKLLAEIRDELVRNKRLPSLMDIVASSAKLKPLPKELRLSQSNDSEDKAPIEAAFQKTTNVLFGRTLTDFESYGDWLKKYIPSVDIYPSVASGKPIPVSDINPCNLFLKDRLVGWDENCDIGEITKLEQSEIGSFDEIKAAIGKIAFLNPGGRLGDTRNLMLVPLSNSSVNCYYCPIASFNDCVAYSYWPRESKYMFGSTLAFQSNFCINAYYSTNLSRAFEVDGSNNCSDIYFAHNCEGVRDSMFCFNAKNLKYAIGNSPLSMEQYKEVKAALLGQLANELKKNKEVPWSIFNIGAIEVCKEIDNEDNENKTAPITNSKKRSRLWHSKLIR